MSRAVARRSNAKKLSEAVDQWINTSQAVIPAQAGIQYLPLISVKTIG